MKNILSGQSFKSLVIAATLLLVGCKDSQKISTFSCSSSDLAELESIMDERGILQATKRVDLHIGHSLLRMLNEKVAAFCPIEVLERCASGHERAVRSANSVLGPIQAFGVNTGTITTETVHKMFGEVNVPKYNVRAWATINPAIFRRTLACFKAEID